MGVKWFSTNRRGNHQVHDLGEIGPADSDGCGAVRVAGVEWAAAEHERDHARGGEVLVDRRGARP